MYVHVNTIEGAEEVGEVEQKERSHPSPRLPEEPVTSDLEETLRQEHMEAGGETLVPKIPRVEPKPIDLSPVLREVASRIQAESNSYDPQLLAQSHAEIAAGVKEIVVSSARAIANEQSPVQHNLPVRVLPNSKEAATAGSNSKTDGEKDTEEVLATKRYMYVYTVYMYVCVYICTYMYMYVHVCIVQIRCKV